MEYRKILDKDESFSKELKDHAINKLDNVVKIDFGKKQ